MQGLEWLDRHGYEPEVFHYRMEAEGVLFRLDFTEPREAEAFIQAFGEAAAVVR